VANSTKTNAMRILDKAGIHYNEYEYDHADGFIDGISVANKIGKPVDTVFKTLVVQGASRVHYVFVIPVAEELDLKAAAKVVGEKSIDMIKVTDIEKITGYIRGGCSPIGMKKDYKTILDSSCKELGSVILSAGKRGLQMELALGDLLEVTHCGIGRVTKSH
jgi:Cys-tRNA(Pro)/Cys-tRNA(Cys) deacylase